MKKNLLLPIIFLAFVSVTKAQDTFSIVAADSTTREVGSAGASCVDLFLAGISDATFIGDLLPDTGAINTQASYLPLNQTNAKARMRAGDSPAQILSWLTVNDAGADSTIRQYGIVRFIGNNVNAMGYTGTNCMAYRNHKTGSINGIHYSIQGNILLGQMVIDSMESRFRNANGDLACRLMAALQGANMIGADTRCTPDGTSSLFSYVKVAQPGDTYGNPSLSVSVMTHDNTQIEPIDSLQILFNATHNCFPAGINETGMNSFVSVYPNPSNGLFAFASAKYKIQSIKVYNVFGQNIYFVQDNSFKTEIDLKHAPKGIYFYLLQCEGDILKGGKLVVQ